MIKITESACPKYISNSNTLKDNLFQEKMEKAANERQEKGQKLRGKRHKLSLTPAT